MIHESSVEVAREMPDPENKKAYDDWVEEVRRQDLERETGNYSVRESSIEGEGWFANRDFKFHDLLSHYLVGRYEDIRLSDQIEPGSDFDRNAVQCGVTPDGKGLYISVLHHPRKYINHSCDPNVGILRRPRAEGGWDSDLISIRSIRKGEEITLDYATTQLEEWSLRGCRCGTAFCRHTITDFAHLPPELQDKYIALGIIPDWMMSVARKG